MQVSVIIPLYNKERTIARAVESVLAQTFVDFELLVIDDGSTDDSAAAVTRCTADARVRVIRQANAGPGVARARGMAEARGAYYAFLDADDTWVPTCLATAVQLMEDFPEAGLGGVGYVTQLPDGTVRPCCVRGITPPWRGVLADYFAAGLADPPISSSSAIVRASVARACGVQASAARLGEDLFLWCQLAFAAPVALDTTVGACWYLAGDGAQLTSVWREEALPFVAWAEARLAAGLPAHVAAESLRRYVDHYHWLTVRSALFRHRNPVAARRALAAWHPLPESVAQWRRLTLLARLPAPLLSSVELAGGALLALKRMLAKKAGGP